jgi:hypothetical protein
MMEPRQDDTNGQQDQLNTPQNNQERNTGDPFIATSCHVAVKMPVFSTANATLFFRRAEAQFHLGAIRDEIKKYYHIFTVLPDDIGELCQTEPTAASPYNALKNELLTICERSRQAKLNDAFATLEVSDEKPSIIARRVARIFSDAGVAASDDMQTHKILQALPQTLAELLHAHTNQSFSDFITVADTVWAARKASGHAACSAVRPQQQPSPSLNPSQNDHRGVMPFNANQRPRVCRAHIYYGASARTCRKWCVFPSTAPRLTAHQPTPQQSRGPSPTPPENENAAAADRQPWQPRQ